MRNKLVFTCLTFFLPNPVRPVKVRLCKGKLLNVAGIFVSGDAPTTDFQADSDF